LKVDTLKDLKKVIQLCRETGVDIIKVDGIELVLGSQPVQKAVKRSISPTETFPGNVGPDTPIHTPDALTDEQMLFYSAPNAAGEI
jgi:hypothetical protein